MSSGRARLFVALDLPGDVRTRVAAWSAGALAGRDALRVMPAASLHITLCFLGMRDLAEVAQIGEAAAGWAGPAPLVALGAPVWLPGPRARVLALDLAADPELERLQAQVCADLAEVAGHEPETRPYRPHVTVARTRGASRVRPFAVAPPPELEFTGSRVTLYRSETTPGGPRYTPVVEHELR